MRAERKPITFWANIAVKLVKYGPLRGDRGRNDGALFRSGFGLNGLIFYGVIEAPESLIVQVIAELRTKEGELFELRGRLI